MAIFTNNTKRYREVSGSAVALNDILFDLEAHEFDWACLQIYGTFTGTTLIEGTNDGVTWYSLPTQSVAIAAVGPITSGITAPGLVICNTPTERVRMRCSAYTSGTIYVMGGLSNGVKAMDLTPPNLAIGAGINIIGSTGGTASATVGVGTTNASVRSAAGNNLTSVKTAGGKLYGYMFQNTHASIDVWLKFYQKASAPVLASDVPAMLVYLKAGQTVEYNNYIGKAWATGLAYAITGLPANTDATAVLADQVVGNIDYI